MDGTWAWIILSALWGFSMWSVGRYFYVRPLEVSGLLLLFVSISSSMVYGSVVFLQHFEAWPFIPQ